MLGRRSTRAQSPAPVVPAVLQPPTLPPDVERAVRAEIELADARQDLADAEVELDASQASYDAAVDAAQLAEAMAVKARTAEAATRRDIGRRHVARLEAELAELLKGAADAAAAAERAQLREAAETALSAYAEAFRARMPALTAGLRDLIRLHALAELAREAAAEKGVSLPRADAFRDVDGSPRVEVSRRELDLWLNPNGDTPFGDDDQRRVKVRSDGIGTLQGRNHLHEATHRRRFEEVAFRPRVPGELAPPLFEHLVLPCVAAGAPAGWSPLKHGTRPRDVLRVLEALEARADAPRPEPEVRVERRALERARDVRKNPEQTPTAVVGLLRSI
ncbi:hypothetical protein MRF4_22135 [Methylobacterium radiotolerans]|uniref:hypothetical protein n=1 Tax=Methylobacterium TaxID=407 RepID=UPI002F2CE601